MLLLRRYIVSIVGCLWLLLLALVAYFSLRDTAYLIDYQTLQNLAKEKNIQTIYADSQYFFIDSKDKKSYKIPIFSLINNIESHTYSNNNDNFDLIVFPFNTATTLQAKTPDMIKISLIAIIGVLGFFILLLYRFRVSLLLNYKNKTTQQQNTILTTQNANQVQEKDNISMHIEPIQSSVRFSDVAGIKEVKDDLFEIIDYLKNPKKYQELGIYLPKGVLLVGPPGVGKTMIAKAIAGESGVPFFYQSGSSFVQMYVGVGAKRVRELFAKARIHAPAIIFIDEIDAVGKARGTDNHHEWESTLNELLTEMDGFSDQSGVVVIGATNQAEVLDHALLRSGRFDRRIYVDLPDIQEREEILKVHLKKRPYDLKLQEVAKLCMGFSGANLASLINEAAINALRKGRHQITMQDIYDTTHKVLFGTKKVSALDTKQKYELAIYNAGKAISHYWFSKDFQKITLMDTITQTPDQYKIKEYSSKDDLLAILKIALSGNLALELNNLGKSTIAKQDIKIAKYIAKEMCEEYGMADKLITNEHDILDILECATKEHKELIVSNKELITNIASILIQKEKITKEEIQNLLQS